MRTKRSASFSVFLFAPTSDEWLSVLRTGVGAQIIFYCVSLRHDWNYLLASSGRGLISRNLSEAIVDLDAPIVPRLTWFVRVVEPLGINEQSGLTLAWSLLLVSGILLLLGLFSRPAAVGCWVLHLAAVKSSFLLSYGADSFTTIA